MNFKGVPYPIVKKAKGYLSTQSDVDQIKSDLLILLLTNPGERVFNSSYGTPLRRLIFEQNDNIIVEQAREMILNSIRSWEPRIAVESVTVTNRINEKSLNKSDLKQDLEHILFISIKFIDPENIKQVEELVLQMPLAS
jgi:phage baseplate assembly protein W